MSETLLDTSPSEPITEAPSVDTTPVDTTPALEQAPQEFKLPENWTANEGMASKFTTLDGLAKSYESLEKMINKKGVIQPTDPADTEAWDKFYNDLGRPQEANGYELTTEVEGINLDEFSKVAYEVGLTPSQAEKLLNRYEGMFVEAGEKLQTQQEAARDSAITNLQQDPRFVGANWDKSINQIKSTMTAELGEEGAAALMSDPSFANNPDAIKLVLNLAQKTGEQSFVQAESQPNTIDMQAKLEEIMNESYRLATEDAFGNNARINQLNNEALQLRTKLSQMG